MTRHTLAILGVVLVAAACSGATSVPPTPAELQADLAAHNTDFVPSNDGFPSESRPDLVAIARPASGGTIKDPDWIYPGTLSYLISPGDYEHSVWAVHFSDTEQQRIGGFPDGGGTVIADVVVFIDSTTLSVILTDMYTLPR